MKRYWTLFSLGCLLWALSPANAVTISEDFAANPLAHGWSIFGDEGLFQWNSTNQNLEVTWDSSQTNSYFYRPLGTILTSNDTFSLEFDLQFDDAVIGGFGFEVAVGLFNLADAVSTNFFRGSGRDAPNIFEFDYFPDFGFGPSIDATLTDRNKRFRFFYDNLPLSPGSTYHIVLGHTAGTLRIDTQIFQDGQPYTTLPLFFFQTPTSNFTAFYLDTVSISSYSGAKSGGSILAHGRLDNLIVTLPPPPVQNLTGAFSNGMWQVEFISRSNWLYTLERNEDFQSWTNVSPPSPGTDTNLTLQDMNSPMDKAFYRIRANRP